MDAFPDLVLVPLQAVQVMVTASIVWMATVLTIETFRMALRAIVMSKNVAGEEEKQRK